jgi:hypothetical protein
MALIVHETPTKGGNMFQQMRFQTPKDDKGDGWVILFAISGIPVIAIAFAICRWLGWA